jgi:hypothetical protein
VLNTPRDFAAGKGPVPYVDNHDHSTVVNRVGGRGAWWKAQPPLLALLTVPGAVLLRNGQEFGADDYVPDGGDNRVVPRPLHWELLQDQTGQALYHLHQRLIALRQECPSLCGGNFYPSDYDERWGHFNDQGYGVDVDKGVAIYHRWSQDASGAYERFIVVLNFSGSDQWVDVPFSVNGPWTDRLSGDVLQVQGYRAANVRIPSHWGRLFYNKG